MSQSTKRRRHRIIDVSIPWNNETVDIEAMTLEPDRVVVFVDRRSIDAWRASNIRLTANILYVDERGKARDAGWMHLPLYGRAFVQGWEFSAKDRQSLAELIRFNAMMTLFFEAKGRRINRCRIANDAVLDVAEKAMKQWESSSYIGVDDMIERIAAARNVEPGEANDERNAVVITTPASRIARRFAIAEDVVSVFSSGGNATFASFIVRSGIGYAPWDSGYVRNWNGAWKQVGRNERLKVRLVVAAANFFDGEVGFLLDDFWTGAIDLSYIPGIESLHPLRYFIDDVNSWVNSADHLDDAPFAFGEQIGYIPQIKPEVRKMARANRVVRRAMIDGEIAAGEAHRHEKIQYADICFALMEATSVFLPPLQAIGDARQLLIDAVNAFEEVDNRCEDDAVIAQPGKRSDDD